MRILITGEVFSFPAGYAATDYVRKLAMGLKSHGAEVFVMPLHFTEQPPSTINTLWRGCHDGIRYAYAPGSCRFPRSQTGWRVLSKLARLHAWLRLAGLMLGSRPRVVLFYGRSFSWFAFLLRWTGRMRIPLVPIVVEWTPAIPDRRAEVVDEENKFYALAARHASKIVVISDALKSEFSRLCVDRPVDILKMPVLCLPEECPSPVDFPATSDCKYFVYCADLNAYLEDALNVVVAFNLLADTKYKLLLIGRVSKKNRAHLQEKISENKIGLVEFVSERLTDTDLRTQYRNATALLLPGADSLRNRMRFPSKLAEYLVSGRPVIASSMGEVPLYLQDGISALLITPASATAMAQAMETCLSSPIDSARIGLCGREVALRSFDAGKVCGLLLEWLSAAPEYSNP